MQEKLKNIYELASADIEKAVLKNEELKNSANTKMSQMELSNAERQAVRQYNDLISTFRDCVNNSEKISYTVCTGYEQGEDQSEAW